MTSYVTTVSLSVVTTCLISIVAFAQDQKGKDIIEEMEEESQKFEESITDQQKEEFEKHFNDMVDKTGENYIKARDAIVGMGQVALFLLKSKVASDEWKIRFTAIVCRAYTRRSGGVPDGDKYMVISKIAKGINQFAGLGVDGAPSWNNKVPEKRTEDPEVIGYYLSKYERGNGNIPYFIEILIKSPNEYPSYGRKGTIFALEKMRDGNSLPLLKDVAKIETNEEVRSAAEHAIKVIEEAIQSSKREEKK